MSRSDSTRTDDEVVLLGHPPGSFHDLFLVIGDDLDLLELDAEVETLFGEKVAVRVAVPIESKNSLVWMLHVFAVM
jgi:hypothetical protein